MIQTVTGAITKADSGAILMHEHISVSSLSFTKAFGQKWLDKSSLKEVAIKTLTEIKQKYGLAIMVDGTPIDLGRDPQLLKEVSEGSDVKIVASTGFYYLPTIESLNNSPYELATWFIDECKNGISGTGIKPGILKCSTGSEGFTEDNLKKLSAMGIVQKETGLPIYVHCEHYGDVAFKQIEILQKNGASAEKIIIGHTAMRPSATYLEEILKCGCYICMDQCHCYPERLSEIAGALVKLCEKGYADKIFLANDYCLHNDFGNRNTNGMQLSAEKHIENMSYIFDKQYKEFISMGGKKEHWNTMLCKNSANVLNV